MHNNTDASDFLFLFNLTEGSDYGLWVGHTILNAPVVQYNEKILLLVSLISESHRKRLKALIEDLVHLKTPVTVQEKIPMMQKN